jgi:hypothetical protein
VQDDGWIVGELLAHGKAPYRHDPGAAESYFVRVRTLETEQGAAAHRAYLERAERPVDGQTPRRGASIHDGGMVERWGNDLERAIRESRSRVETGDRVALKIVARTPIVSATPASEQGRDPPRYWNRWEVEKVQYVAQRNRFAHAVNDNRRKAREDGIEGKEALALYLIHEGAERLAAARYLNASDRKAFVDRVRNFLAVSPERVQLIAGAAARLHSRKAETPTHPQSQREPLARE